MLILHTREVYRLLSILNDLESYAHWNYNCIVVILQCVEDRHATNLVSNLVRRQPVQRWWMMENLFDEHILNTLLKDPQDGKALVFGLALFSEISGIMVGVGADSSRRTHDFVLDSCYLQRNISFLWHVWNIYLQSRLPYCILNYLSMYKALMVCGESSIAQTMVEHISGNDIDEHVDRIRNACDKGV
nr:hypothetical protein [Tanacetum cinerariifolium]